MKTQTATKVVQVIARITYKRNPKAVTYLVRSSNGIDQYQTTIYNGKAVSCSCPATKPCYHMKQLETREASRQPQLIPAASLVGYDIVGAALRIVNECRNAEAAGNVYELLAQMRKAVAEVPSFVERDLSIGCEYCGKNHSAANCPF